MATLGMAIGAGNIWRFPRVAARNGGGAFLIPWLLAIVFWSAPLLMIEFGLGKATRKGPVAALATVLGKRRAWVGAFVALVTSFIMFYYSVVTGWSAWYFLASITRFDALSGAPTTAWHTLTGGSIWAVIFHVIAAVGAALILVRGVASGVERVCKVLVPLLLVLLLAAAVRSLTLPGGITGLEFLFHIDGAKLARADTWLAALSQSAWSTGAGWGLMLTYGAYARKNEDVALNSTITAVGNNAASILAAMAILPAIFALSASTDQAMAITGSDNTGLAFIWVPRLFARMPAGGAVFAALFFAALTAASLSSLIAMMAMATQVIQDLGLSRKKALALVAGATIVMGLPSALSLRFFENQDWVWGLGLLVSGGLFAMAAISNHTFRKDWINTEGADWRVGPWLDIMVRYVIPTEFVALLGWWFYQSITTYAPHQWWNPLSTFSVGTCIVQWGIVFVVLMALSSWLYRRSISSQPAEPKKDSGGPA